MENKKQYPFYHRHNGEYSLCGIHEHLDELINIFADMDRLIQETSCNKVVVDIKILENIREILHKNGVIQAGHEYYPVTRLPISERRLKKDGRW